MRFKSLILIGSILGLGGSASHADPSEPFCRIVPENHFKNPVRRFQEGGIDEKTFNQVIDRISTQYEPVVKGLGGNLKVIRLWSDATVNAYALRKDNDWIIKLYGGFAREKDMTADAFALVMCHEMGHHLGRYPRYQFSPWAASEGQSDYFAVMKCFRKAFQNDDHVKVLAKRHQEVPAIVKEKCSVQFKTASEIAFCQRSAIAGKTLATVMWQLTQKERPGNGGKKPDWLTPDPSQVPESRSQHSGAQCRLDTYFSGSVCGVSHTEDFSYEGPTPGSCAEEKKDRIGFRPRCWYKPNLSLR